MGARFFYMYEGSYRRSMAEHRHADGRQMFRGTFEYDAAGWKIVRDMYRRMRRAGVDVVSARHVIVMLSMSAPVRGERQPSLVAVAG